MADYNSLKNAAILTPTAGTDLGSNSNPYSNVFMNGNIVLNNSGVVLVSYADSFAVAASTTGSPTLLTSGGLRVYKFTQSGSITF
jgi:hypothetical protein